MTKKNKKLSVLALASAFAISVPVQQSVADYWIIDGVEYNDDWYDDDQSASDIGFDCDVLPGRQRSCVNDKIAQGLDPLTCPVTQVQVCTSY